VLGPDLEGGLHPVGRAVGEVGDVAIEAGSVHGDRPYSTPGRGHVRPWPEPIARTPSRKMIIGKTRRMCGMWGADRGASSRKVRYVGSLRNPVGPLPSSIYWRRRAVLASAAALAALLAVWFVSSGGGGTSTNGKGGGDGSGPARTITPGPSGSGPA